MPSRRLCIKCGALTPRGSSYCDQHRRRRGGQLGWSWTVIRNDYLKRHPLCEQCGAKAVTVDHIIARAFGGTDDEANLQSLCRACAKVKDHADSVEGMRRKRRGVSGTPGG